jgi:hypothetical protein
MPPAGTYHGIATAQPRFAAYAMVSRAPTVSRLVNGKIAEEWELMDALGMLVQLGAVPQPATA